MNPIRVVQFGLGPIGQACIEVLLQKPSLELVGGIDIDPQKVGRDIGEICGLNKSLGIAVRGDVAAALADWRPQVVVHTTLSFLDRVEEQLATIIRAGAHVVSSTEELFYPFQRNPEFCQRIDTLAKQHGVAVVSTGINPGFAMDILPLCLTGVCTEVNKIILTRVVDTSQRRLTLQEKTKVIVVGDLNDEPSDRSLVDHLRASNDLDRVVGRTNDIDGFETETTDYRAQEVFLFNTTWKFLPQQQVGTDFLDGLRSGEKFTNRYQVLDQLIASRGLLTESGLTLDLDSVDIFRDSLVATRSGRPRPFSKKTRKGTSDHLPLTAVLRSGNIGRRTTAADRVIVMTED